MKGEKMNLFSNEKSLFLKITNIILLIWLIVALTVSYSSIINVLFPEPALTYEEYEISYCRYFEEGKTETEKEELCKSQYEQEKVYKNRGLYDSKKGIFISSGNVVIVALALFLLNRKKEVK
jgi:hypothetical protein